MFPSHINMTDPGGPPLLLTRRMIDRGGKASSPMNETNGRTMGNPLIRINFKARRFLNPLLPSKSPGTPPWLLDRRLGISEQNSCKCLHQHIRREVKCQRLTHKSLAHCLTRTHQSHVNALLQNNRPLFFFGPLIACSITSQCTFTRSFPPSPVRSTNSSAA